MARLLPLYRWRCLTCRTFPDRDHYMEVNDRYGVRLKICLICSQPLALVKVKYVPNKIKAPE